MLLRGLYGITDISLCPYDRVLEMAESAIAGGMRILQLRDKINSDDSIFDIALKLKKICNKNGVIFIVDDRIDLALELGADGIHVGKDDMDIREFRDKFPNKIVGVSCYGDIDRALEMESLGANYIAFGSFFTSATKPKAPVVEKNIISEAKKKLKIPICAIGGLNVQNSKELVDMGVDMIAVISDLWGTNDIKNRALEYTSLFKDEI